MYHCQPGRGVMSARHLCCAPGLTLQLLCVCSCSAAASDNFIGVHGSLFRVEVTRSMRVFALCVFSSILLIAPRVNKSLVVNDAAPLRSHTRFEKQPEKGFVDELGVFCGCCHWILTHAQGLLIPHYAREVRINTPRTCVMSRCNNCAVHKLNA
jgi:hypothetical protein